MCQSCGKEIKPGQRVIRVQYGTLGKSGSIKVGATDLFHTVCDVAIANPV